MLENKTMLFFASGLIKTKITALMTFPPKVKQPNDDFITL